MGSWKCIKMKFHQLLKILEILISTLRYRVRFCGVIWNWISVPRSLGSWCIKETDESMTRVDSSVTSMYNDLSDVGSLILIQITPKERTIMHWNGKNKLHLNVTAYLRSEAGSLFLLQVLAPFSKCVCPIFWFGKQMFVDESFSVARINEKWVCSLPNWLHMRWKKRTNMMRMKCKKRVM